jgi:hypothetical protein
MKKVIIESPYAGDREKNLDYARKCLQDSLARGEAPFASHLLYTQVLEDSIPLHREIGMSAGFLWMESADLIAVYLDRGRTRGMDMGILRATKLRIPIEFRSIHAGVKLDA